MPRTVAHGARANIGVGRCPACSRTGGHGWPPARTRRRTAPA